MNHALDLLFYNTASRQKELLRPLQEGRIKMYTCGPTVYNFAHIGNFRCYVFEDLLRRTLQFFGYQVTQVMNLTDVDDKTIRGAIQNQISLKAYTQPFKEAFFEDLATLRIQRVEHYPAATDYIQPMVEMIQKLLDLKIGYLGGDGSIYFAIRKFPHYGCLSHLKLEELQAGASDRIQTDEYEKDSVADFVLWKKYDPERDGQIYWESPFGRGRPGWHLECSAMACDILGESIDIHCGGIDNMFPHHENEIAQSEACSGKRFVNLWMHCEHLVVDHKKMSKSLGNFYTLRDLVEKGYSGRQVRMLLLQTHYKTQLNFSLEGLEGARHSLQRLHDFVARLREVEGTGTGKAKDPINKALNDFSAALADDLNISVAMAALFDCVRSINILADNQGLGKEDAEAVIALLQRFNTVLDLIDFETTHTFSPELLALLEQRQQARKAKEWSAADEIRKILLEKGFLIEDTPQGARLKKVGS